MTEKETVRDVIIVAIGIRIFIIWPRKYPFRCVGVDIARPGSPDDKFVSDLLGGDDVPFFIDDREAGELLDFAQVRVGRIGPFVLCTEARDDVKRLLQDGQIIIV